MMVAQESQWNLANLQQEAKKKKKKKADSFFTRTRIAETTQNLKKGNLFLIFFNKSSTFPCKDHWICLLSTPLLLPGEGCGR